MLELTTIIPFFAGIIAIFMPVRVGRGILVLTALLHLQLTVMGWLGKITPAFPEYFAVTDEGMLILRSEEHTSEL